MRLFVNAKKYELPNVDPETPLLFVLRDYLGLTGTKYGCGIGSCGVCLVLVDDQPVNSCLVSVSSVEGRQIETIEILSKNSEHPVQKAWIEAQAPQCGYCQSGQIMMAVAYLRNNPDPDEESIKSHFSRILCRCGSYPRIIEAVKIAAKSIKQE